jgi:hypothetical protein
MSQQLARQADIYARNGLTDQAEQYRLKAYDVSRQEEADARVRTEYEQKQNTNNAAQWMAEQISSGRTADMTLIAEAQTKFKGNYDTLLSTTANVLGINDKIAKQKTERLVNQINEAVLGGEESFNKLLGSFADPNKEDNIVPMLKRVKGGVQVMYGDKPMSPLFAGADGVSPLQQAGAFYINTAQSKPFETAIQMQNLAKGAAAIKASEAQVRASDSTVGLNNARAKGLARDADTVAKLDRIDQQLEAIPPDQMNGPVARGLIMQRNAIVAGSTKQVPLSAAPRPEVPAAAVVDYAKNLIGKPSGEMKDGKPVKYTAETAAAAARKALSAQDGAAAPADPADALIEAMRRNTPAQPRATPAGQSLVNLSNAMLPPAAAPRTAPVTSQERLRGLYLGQ